MSATIHEFPKAAQAERDRRGAGAASAALAPSPDDAAGVAASSDFLSAGVDHLVELGCDRGQAWRWFACGAVHGLAGAAGVDEAVEYLIRLAAALTRTPTDDPPRAA